MTTALSTQQRDMIVRQIAEVETELKRLEFDDRIGTAGRIRQLRGQLRALANLLWAHGPEVL